MKKMIVTLLGFLLIINLGYAQSKKKSGNLDRKTYACDVTPDGKKKAKAVPDELKFSGGTFQCKLLLGENFKVSEYDATVDSSTSPPTITFTCEAKDEKENVFIWTGKVTGDDIEGTATLTNKKGKTEKSFSFSGTLKGKKSKKG
jgi:hypothetical protein